jgi:hypothetical protein
MSMQGIPASTPPPPKPSDPGPYVAPRLSARRSLEVVTLESMGGRPTPGGPGWIGHP